MNDDWVVICYTKDAVDLLLTAD